MFGRLARAIVPSIMLFAASSGGALTADSSTLVAESAYTILDLGTLEGTDYGYARAINDRGQVVGSSGGRAALWDDGGIKDLDTRAQVDPNYHSAANDITAQALIVGDSGGFFNSLAVFWDRGPMTHLPLLVRPAGTFGNHRYSMATGINERGQIVGSSEGHAVRWQDGAVTDLGTLADASIYQVSSAALGINQRGQIVGYSYTADSPEPHAALWDSGVVTDLGPLAGATYTIANAINGRGQIVGQSGSHAVLWQDGAVIELAALPGASDSVAYGINERGQIVGQSGSRAVLWQDGAVIELAALLGASDSVAYDINERGQIVGQSGSRAVRWER
jgi:probable HAF family extracellular repeat protein